MASDNSNISSRAVNVSGPRYDPDVRFIADNIDTMLKEREKIGEERARVHFASTITSLKARLENATKVVAHAMASREFQVELNTDLEASLKAWQGRAAKAQARADKAKADADKAKADANDRVARVTADYQARTRQAMQLLQLSEQSDNAASSGAHVGNESGGSAAGINSSITTEQQSNQPEQQLSPSSSDNTANARIKSEDVETMQLLEWGSSTSERSGLIVDEIDSMEQAEHYKRLRELEEAIDGRSEDGDKRQRTE